MAHILGIYGNRYKASLTVQLYTDQMFHYITEKKIIFSWIIGTYCQFTRLSIQEPARILNLVTIISLPIYAQAGFMVWHLPTPISSTKSKSEPHVASVQPFTCSCLITFATAINLQFYKKQQFGRQNQLSKVKSVKIGKSDWIFRRDFLNLSHTISLLWKTFLLSLLYFLSVLMKFEISIPAH